MFFSTWSIHRLIDCLAFFARLVTTSTSRVKSICFLSEWRNSSQSSFVRWWCTNRIPLFDWVIRVESSKCLNWARRKFAPSSIHCSSPRWGPKSILSAILSSAYPLIALSSSRLVPFFSPPPTFKWPVKRPTEKIMSSKAVAANGEIKKEMDLLEHTIKCQQLHHIATALFLLRLQIESLC